LITGIIFQEARAPEQTKPDLAGKEKAEAARKQLEEAMLKARDKVSGHTHEE
jgi:hypothetical protein